MASKRLHVPARFSEVLGALTSRPKPEPAIIDDESLILLRQIAADVRVLRDLAEREASPCRPDADLLRLLLAAVGNRVFRAVDIVAHAALPEAVDLRVALGSTDARRIGKLLRKLEGADAGGLTVNRVGEDRDGAIWMVAGVRE